MLFIMPVGDAHIFGHTGSFHLAHNPCTDVCNIWKALVLSMVSRWKALVLSMVSRSRC
jgi:hypothetical protein